MALFHINLLEAQRGYDLAPKSVQDMIDQQEQKFVGQLRMEPFQPVQSVWEISHLGYPGDPFVTGSKRFRAFSRGADCRRKATRGARLVG
jgi:hypothetical protein